MRCRCVVTPFTRRRGNLKPFRKFLKDNVNQVGTDTILSPKDAMDGFQRIKTMSRDVKLPSFAPEDEATFFENFREVVDGKL